MPSWSVDVPEGFDFAWCPQGCGGATEDPYGGPCKACWRKVDEVDEIERCADAPEGDSRHDYRLKTSSFYQIGTDLPSFRKGENAYHCRVCGDVFVALDDEMEERDYG